MHFAYEMQMKTLLYSTDYSTYFILVRSLVNAVVVQIWKWVLHLRSHQSKDLAVLEWNGLVH